MKKFLATLYRNGILSQETVEIKDCKKESKEYPTRGQYLDSKLYQALGKKPICYSQIN